MSSQDVLMELEKWTIDIPKDVAEFGALSPDSVMNLMFRCEQAEEEASRLFLKAAQAELVARQFSRAAAAENRLLRNSQTVDAKFKAAEAVDDWRAALVAIRVRLNTLRDMQQPLMTIWKEAQKIRRPRAH